MEIDTKERNSKAIFPLRIFLVWIILLTPLVAMVTIVFYPELNMERPVSAGYNQNNPNVVVAMKLDEDDSVNVNDRQVMTSLMTSFLPPESLVVVQSKSAELLPLIRSKRDMIPFGNMTDWSEKESRDNKIELWRTGGQSDEEKYVVRRAQARLMLSYMDQTMDPCQDFYQYACGNWTQMNPIPPDKAGFDVFETLREHLDLILRDLLESDDKIEKPKHKLRNQSTIDNKNGKTESNIQNQKIDAGEGSGKMDSRRGAIDKVKALYRSCINQAIVEERSHRPLSDLLRTLGGWPIADGDWNEANFDWIWAMAQLRLYNNDILLSQWVGPDIRNSEVFIVQFDQTTLGLPTRDYFLNSVNQKYLEAYKEFISSVAFYLGGNNSTIENDTINIIEFEIRLANITYKPEERHNISMMYNKMTLKELNKLVPNIDFKRYLSIVLERTIEGDEMVVIYATRYAQALSKLISETPPRTVANYLLWRFVRHRVNNLDDRFQHAKQKFFQSLLGSERSPPRWKNCVGQTNGNMGMAVGSLFVGRHFDESSKNDTITMTRLIQASFKSVLDAAGWIDAETRLLAERKIDAMLLRIGYPDFILNGAELDRFYANVHIDEDKYFENTLNILKHLSRNEQEQVGKPVNKSLWNTAPAVVNAYYSRNKNQILFPAGILQPPFYHRHFPRSINYGGIGMVIGHEIMHGFDDKGRLFDHNGNLCDWWQNNVSWEFHSRAQCLISQYSQYVMDDVDLPLDGLNTQGENIADNGGIKPAFRAYKTWLGEHSAEETDEVLEDVPATPKQLFFLNFAQIWCGVMRPEATRNKLKTAVHSPGRYRVIGTLSNMDDFAEAFNCPIGTPMNPSEKCIIW